MPETKHNKSEHGILSSHPAPGCQPHPPAKEISRNGRKLYWKYWKDEKEAEGLKENRLEKNNRSLSKDGKDLIFKKYI